MEASDTGTCGTGTPTSPRRLLCHPTRSQTLGHRSRNTQEKARRTSVETLPVTWVERTARARQSSKEEKQVAAHQCATRQW